MLKDSTNRKKNNSLFTAISSFMAMENTVGWSFAPGTTSVGTSEFIQVALRHGVVVVAGSRFSSDESWNVYIRISFADNGSTIQQGIERLARAWKAYQEKGAITVSYPSPIV